MQLAIRHTSELGPDDLARWRDSMRQGSFRSPFLTPTFTEVVGRHRPASRVAVLSDDRGTVAFLPYERDAEHVGRPIGHVMNDVQALIGRPPEDCDLRQVVRCLGVREWRYDHLLATQEAFSAYTRGTHHSPTIDLSNGHAAWMEALKRESSLVAKNLQQVRRLGRDVGPVTIEWCSGESADLERLLQLKSDQYLRTGASDVLDPPWVRAVLREFWLARSEECAGVLGVLRAGDETIALHLGLVGDGVLHYWFPAYDPDYSKYSPGVMLLLGLAERAPEHGVDLIDLGMGEHPYKLRVANSGYEVRSGRVPARGGAYRASVLVRRPQWLGRRIRSWGGRLTDRDQESG